MILSGRWKFCEARVRCYSLIVMNGHPPSERDICLFILKVQMHVGYQLLVNILIR